LFTTNVDDQPGVIKAIYVREYNSIDGLQFIYANHDGNFIGNQKGGRAHYIANFPRQAPMWFANGLS